MARDFVIEIGTEELPSSFVAGALEAMPSIARTLLQGARLQHGAVHAMGTPRRLALQIQGLAERQDDLAELVFGPPADVAFDAQGQPARAAEGFARKQGVAVGSLITQETEKGRYVAARREESGKPASEVLGDVLHRLCHRIPFPKSMRWADLDIPFGRPVHWLVALHGTDVVPAEFAGCHADRHSRGHRFLAPGPVEISSADGYVEALRAAHVVVDIDERRRQMCEALERTAAEVGGVLVEDAFLVDECVSLVEEPHVVAGRFDEAFLSLPDQVIVSVMRDHQRYFAVRDGEGGKLLPRYLNVVNTANDPETIARGNDRVLRARLADAQFFVDEDRKHRLEDRARELHGIVFQQRLGTIGDKVERVRALADSIRDALQSRQDADDARAAHALRDVAPENVRQAATLCKADLVTQIVGEFPELQGEAGRWYAREQGVADPVADAIRDHYSPRTASDDVPRQPLGALLAVADRIDTLVGCFGIDLTPSGSADPYGLRRAALGVIRIALESPLDVDLGLWVTHADTRYRQQDRALASTLHGKLDEFFRARLRAFYADRLPADLIEACLGPWGGADETGAWRTASLRDLDARVRAMAQLRDRPEYTSFAVAFKRTFNIAGDAPTGDPDPALYAQDEERRLADAFAEARPRIERAIGGGRYDEALSLVARELREPIDGFFDEVFVMVDDARVRDNRLRLLGRIADVLGRIAHFQLLSA